MGDFLRPFLQLLQTTARQGEVIYFEPLEGVLRLRSVSASRTVYLLATVATEHMNGYRYSGKSSAAAGVTLDGVDEARGETSRGGADVECHLPILGKALLSTVLRQGQQLRSLSVHYTDEDCDVGTGDTMRWECIVGDGTVKTFLLQLLDKMPERILISPDAYTFDACAPAKIWGSFLRHLPSSPYVIIQPRRQHLELLVINFSKGAEQEPDSTIVVWPSDLLFMHQKSTANSSIDSDVPLPGKVIDAKPFKQVCMLADQLGMMIRVRSGVEKLPLFVETITAQEVGEVAAGRASAFLSDGPEGSLSDGPVSRLMPLFSPFRVRFSMYISANDIALPEVFGPNNLATASRRSTNSSLTGPRDSSSFVGVCPSPRSTAIATSKPSHGDPKASTRSRLPQAAIDHPVAATPVTTIGERVVDSGFNSVAVSPPLRPVTLCESTPQEGSEEQVLPSSSHVQDSEARFDVNMGVEQEVAPPCDGLSCAAIKDLHRGVTVSGLASFENEPISSHSNASKRQRSWDGSDEGPYAQLGTTGIDLRCEVGTGERGGVVGVKQSESQLESDRMKVNPSSVPCSQLALEARYPLDFAEFMSSMADEWNSDWMDEGDEELQRFLDSCTTVLVVPSTQT